jgi:hypothetical protein
MSDLSSQILCDGYLKLVYIDELGYIIFFGKQFDTFSIIDTLAEA